MKKLFLKIFISIFFYTPLIYGSNLHNKNKYFTKAIPNKENVCKITPAFNDDFEPLEFNKSNNLTRTEGDIAVIKNEKIVLEGQIVDQHCVPIKDAKIYIWQPDDQGNYNYELAKANLKTTKFLKQKNISTFLGSGTNISNNLGKFEFITIFPGSRKGHKPYFNVKVVHPKYGNFQTRFYMKDLNIYENSDPCLQVKEILRKQSKGENYIVPIKYYKFKIAMYVGNNIKSY